MTTTAATKLAEIRDLVRRESHGWVAAADDALRISPNQFSGDDYALASTHYRHSSFPVSVRTWADDGEVNLTAFDTNSIEIASIRFRGNVPAGLISPLVSAYLDAS